MNSVRFLSVALNPAMDILLHSDSFYVNGKNIINSASHFPGGKGFNVAVMLAKLGQSSSVIGFMGSKERGQFLASAKILSIKTFFIDAGDHIRANYKIINDQNGQCTEFNQPGSFISTDDVYHFINLFRRIVHRFDFVSFSGSIPPGISQNLYYDLIKIAKENDVQCALDASGEALLTGVESVPQILRINLGELDELRERKLKNTQQIIGAIQELHNKGIRLIVISRGKMGAIASDGQEIWNAIPPRIKSVNPIGAGDAMLAGCLLQKSKGSNLEELIRFSTAFATTSIGFDDLQSTNMEFIDDTIRKTQLINIH